MEETVGGTYVDGWRGCCEEGEKGPWDGFYRVRVRRKNNDGIVLAAYTRFSRGLWGFIFPIKIN